MVWDVGRRKGVWQRVDAIIEDLDRRNRGWRKRERVVVRLPMKQGTDPRGLNKLMSEVASHELTGLQARKGLHLRFQIDTASEAGQQMAKTLAHLRESGHAGAVQGKELSIVGPPQFHDATGIGVGDGELRLEIGQARIERGFPVRVEASSTHGVESIDTELKCVRAGTNEFEFSNEHAGDGVVINLAVREDDKLQHFSGGWDLPYSCDDVENTRRALAMRRALIPGGKLSIFSRPSGKPFFPAFTIRASDR